MKRYLWLLLIMAAYFLFCSKSCNSGNEQEEESPEVQYARTRDSLMDEFGSGDLSWKTLRAFEVKACQKLADLSDYLNIYFDRSLDTSMKNQAGLMIRDLFIDNNVLINLQIPDGTVPENLTLNELLKLNSLHDFDSLVFHFDSVMVIKPLQRADAFSYSGEIGFYELVSFGRSPENRSTAKAYKTVQITSVMVNKSFGPETLKIWKVYLGSIQ